MKNQIENEKGMITIEASIWIPFLCVIILSLFYMIVQWAELGIVQGELLVEASEAIAYGEEELQADKNEKEIQVHFLKNLFWKVEKGKKEWTKTFVATLQKPFDIQVSKKVKVISENPIKKIRRRERIGEAIQKDGLS